MEMEIQQIMDTQQQHEKSKEKIAENQMCIKNDCAVKIAVRQRPFNNTTVSLIDDHQQQQYENIITHHADNIISVEGKPFAFDYILGPEITQEKLFDTLIRPLILKLLNGFCCTVLAYGQTGTGKSYTMGLQTDEECNEINTGMIPRALTEVFNIIQTKNDKEKTIISVSFLEIYNEKVYDLLSDNYSEQINTKGWKFFRGTKLPVVNLIEATKLLRQGNKNRHVRPTKMNVNSSRSHAVFTIHASTEPKTQSAFHLVDLAGSESVRRTGHQGVALTEGVHINQGLLSIGKVLQALSDGGKVIPYRDSVLSTVLQDSLNLNSYLTLVACISSLKDDYCETLSTLRFAENAKSVRHTPQVNAFINDIKKKTPAKSFMAPLRSRNQITPTPHKSTASSLMPFITSTAYTTIKRKPYQQNNTFCTPNKVRRMDFLKRSRSELILTPTQKKKLHVEENSYLDETRSATSATFTRENTIQSIDESLIIDCPSSFINISTSTAIDGKDLCEKLKENDSNKFSYSPILRKMEEYQNNLLEKFEITMNAKFKTINSINSQQNNSHNNNNNTVVKLLNNDNTTINNITDSTIAFNNDIDCTVLTSTDHPTNLNEIYKTPKSQIILPCDKSIECTVIENNIGTKSSSLSPLSTPSTSASLSVNSSILENIILNKFKVPDIPTSTMTSNTKTNSNKIRHTISTTTFKGIDSNSSGILGITQIDKSNLINNNNNNRRRSQRLLLIKNRSDVNESNNNTVNIVNKTKLKKNSSKSNGNSNKITAPLYNLINIKPGKDAKNKHKENILKLLNTGNIKEIQFLPQIGLKTAYQIITHRSLNGKFKNLDAISKLPIWRGKSWNRFLEINNLS